VFRLSHTLLLLCGGGFVRWHRNHVTGATEKNGAAPQVRSIDEGNRVNVAMRTAMACAAFGGVLLAFFLFEQWLASSKMSKAKEAISQMLVDPDSAQFHDLRRAKRIGGREVICGEVNAKNKLGGYVGRQPFAYDPSIGVAVFLAADSWRSYQEYFLACGVPNPAPWRS
jgi:hypothetical protein